MNLILKYLILEAETYISKKNNKVIRENIGIKSRVKYVESKVGDAKKTFCDNSKIAKKFIYKFEKSIDSGVKEFVNWYLKYYKIKYLKNSKF